jgi:DNA-binding NarL/FixJ family response regulator
MPEEIKIIIADDHQMFIDGVKALLRKEKSMHFVCEASNAEVALNYINGNEVDLLITDISMPGMSGTELARRVKQEFPQVKVLVLTMFNDPAILNEIIQSEAEGYILKNTGKQELLNAINKIMSEGTYYSNEVLSLMSSAKGSVQKASQPPGDALTNRELEILRLVCEECTTDEIAGKLFISVHTVDTHRKNILRKTRCRTLVGLIKYAFEQELI